MCIESCSEKMGADLGRNFWVMMAELLGVVSTVADEAGGHGK